RLRPGRRRCARIGDASAWWGSPGPPPLPRSRRHLAAGLDRHRSDPPAARGRAAERQRGSRLGPPALPRRAGAMRRPIPRNERGAALLAVLLLVAVTGAIAAAAMEGLRLSRAVAANATALDQARAFAGGVEQLALLTLDDRIAESPERTTLDGGWNGAVRRVPLPGGARAEARLRDGGNCFNLNSVVEGMAPTALVRRASGVS